MFDAGYWREQASQMRAQADKLRTRAQTTADSSRCKEFRDLAAYCEEAAQFMEEGAANP